VKLLVANRGEIACRVLRTAREMGLPTVAVYSDADVDAPHVALADEAVRIGPPPSRESYLVVDKILEAARKTGATAVHPGYGFLSENAAFAEACEAAGLIFVGPTPAAIRAMGLKREAKQIARAAGVPVVPGYDGDDQSDARLAAEAEAIGFPVLLKASAGGGGKGMRIVRATRELAEAIAGARREAVSAFGDGTLLIEKYVDEPRHVEIQILGDAHGALVHLFERECSIQRRHQKIVEETPSTALDPALRARMGESAVKVARAIGYRSAGTVEFIVAPDGAYYFLEVNTRLQVEHPVTECVTGLDLVREQLRVARGEPLGYTQAELRQQGHAIEVRLYAEDPASHFLPASGRLVDWHVAPVAGLRVDGGVVSGQQISIHYDPLLAKLIVHAPTRTEAIDRMIRALSGVSAQGIKTNRQFLIRTLDHAAFRAGHTHTHFIDQHLQGALAERASPELVREATVLATVYEAAERARARTLVPDVVPGFRNNRFADERVAWIAEGESYTVAWRWSAPHTLVVTPPGGAETGVHVVGLDGPTLVIEEDRVRRAGRVIVDGERVYVHTRFGSLALARVPRFPAKVATVAPGAAVAPMPGKVVLVNVSEGAQVEAGAVLLVLEAMKMEHSVRAAHAGLVAELRVKPGDQVEADQVLVVVTPQ
jgi:3-methylcrotonyl-CoA carboxylase alpha subunit